MGGRWWDRAEGPARRWIRPVLWVVVLLPALVLVTQLLTNRLGANPIEELEHASGEMALRILIASLAVTPLIRLSGWGWLIPQRRFLGLAAFFWTVGHLSVYTVLDWFFDWSEIAKDILKHLYITVGMLGFVLMLPLAVTSTKGWIRRMGGQKWNRLHRLAYLAVVAGCVHFVWAVKKDLTEPLIYAAVAGSLLLFRVLWRPRPPQRGAPNGVRV